MSTTSRTLQLALLHSENISLVAERQVSFGPLEDPDDIKVKPRQISILDFTPVEPAGFTMRFCQNSVHPSAKGELNPGRALACA